MVTNLPLIPFPDLFMWEYHQPVVFEFLITVDVTGLGKLRFVGGQVYQKIKLRLRLMAHLSREIHAILPF